MNYLDFDLGRQRRGAVAVITLSGSAANVRLLDSTNLSRYKRGDQHRYHGGHVTRSPHRIVIPQDGSWHLVVDTGGYEGRVNASVRVEGSPAERILPPASQPVGSHSPLASIRDNLASAHLESEGLREQAETSVDVFISHASEDKDEVARPLAAALEELGLSVWFDESTLRLGDSLRRKIDDGLARCRFGVVLLSKAFFAKNWPQYELDGLVTREQSGAGQLILPIWHNLSKDEIVAISPSLADKVAVRTSDLTVGEIATQIADVVGPGA